MKKLSVLFTVLLICSSIFAQTKYTPEEEFFMEYSRQQEATQQRLDLMNRKNNMQKLGEETIEGLISGTLHYKTQLKGMKCLITLTYTNYCDVEGWLFNGSVITFSNMYANGTLDGTVVAEGLGKVEYKNVILQDGKAGGGAYRVTLPKGTPQDVDYELFFVACPEKR